MKIKVKSLTKIKLGLLSIAVLSVFVSLSQLTTASTDRTQTGKTSSQQTTAAPEAVFTNSAPITILDADLADPYPSNINVTGLSGNITSVKVSLNGFTHSFPDDIGVLVQGPGGQSILLMDGCGDDPDMTNVTFRLVDGGTVIPNLTAWPAGDYKPTGYFTGDPFDAPGPGTVYNHPGPAGGNTATFASTYNGTAANGIWKLFVIDFVSGDEGEITGGWTLDITTDGVGPTPTPTPTATPTPTPTVTPTPTPTVTPTPTPGPVGAQHVLDFDGDGSTDFTVVRNTGGGSGGAVTWFIDPAGAGANVFTPWGIASDFFISGDYDGDNKSDIAVWRPGAPTVAAFYILQSSTNTLKVEQFGQTGDDPTIVGDYDNDGKDDVAVYRAGASAGAQSFWYWRVAAGGPVFARQWGQNGDFPAPGDYDGDGRADFSVQRGSSGAGIFHTLAAASGTYTTTQWGNSSDVIVPGDYDGDGKTDYAVLRGSSGNIIWSIKMSAGGADIFGLSWGLSATDFPTHGDYDGDGKTDIAVWRPNADTTQNFFYVRRTSNGSLLASEWGQNGDYPVANFNSH